MIINIAEMPNGKYVPSIRDQLLLFNHTHHHTSEQWTQSNHSYNRFKLVLLSTWRCIPLQNTIGLHKRIIAKSAMNQSTIIVIAFDSLILASPFFSFVRTLHRLWEYGSFSILGTSFTVSTYRIRWYASQHWHSMLTRNLKMVDDSRKLTQIVEQKNEWANLNKKK